MPYSPDTKYLLKQSGIDIHRRSSTSPISLRKVGLHFGLKFRKLPLHQNTCGMIVPSNNGIYITINSDHPYTRRRFSTAHEIGHYFLGHESDVTQTHDEDRYEEVQANKFASCLLMPDELFWFVHNEQTSIKEMASWLRVSPISVAIRCSHLGIRHLESELVRSDYFLAEEEMSFHSSRTKSHQNHKQQEVIQVPKVDQIFQPHQRNETLWKKNSDALDRLRRIYGYD
ncbi:ImmA/IrrE family metallo-endopeptidase [Cohnella herbarum]|uniref:ImmA/IrrE family metallo-endopeptidase n=1 Tax=Cohnella herbarum TaxID=2728023 RepID=A0A7Z2ZPV3_9BACL|nr:ImmA/IrrE family metallo-endopeptidase [Cohnella herbarum]